MATREFNFVTGIETSTAPTASDPSSPSDPITLGFADERYVQGGPPVADLTALAALDVSDLRTGDCFLVVAENKLYRFVTPDSTAANSPYIVAPGAGAGRWYRVGELTTTGKITLPNDATLETVATFAEGSTPSTPASGYRTLYATAAGFSQIDSTGAVSGLGSGSGGDSSFTITGVLATGETTIAGGYLIDEQGVEYASYDGTGTTSSDYGTNLIVDMDTLVPSPSSNTTYNLYIDKTLVDDLANISDNNRRVHGVQLADIVASTVRPFEQDLTRYIPIGWTRYVTSSWSTSVFGSFASKRHDIYLESLNPIKNNNAERGTTGWETYDDGASATPVDGTGGSPSAITWTANTTTPLRGGYDFKLTKSAADGQGEGASYAFTLDKADRSTVLTISFDLDASATNYVASDMGVYIYDVDNTTLITPTIANLPKEQSRFTTTFNAGAGTNYRLIFHVKTTNASAYNVYVDDIKIFKDTTAAAIDYAEGTWSPAENAKLNLNTVSFASANAKYTQTGRLITATIDSISFASITSTSNARTFLDVDITGLPSPVSSQYYGGGFLTSSNNSGLPCSVYYTGASAIRIELVATAAIGSGAGSFKDVFFHYYV